MRHSIVTLVLSIVLVVAGYRATGTQKAHAVSNGALPRSAGVQPARAPIQESAAGQGGTAEGIKVHGDWTIEVRDPDGTQVSRTEFENAFDPGASNAVSYIFSRARVLGGWGVSLANTTTFNGPCVNTDGSGFECLLMESTDSYSISGAQFIFKTLTVAFGTDANAGKVVLKGTATAGRSGAINSVSTRFETCNSNTISPSSCVSTVNFANGGTFTATTLASPVSVAAGQQILVTVTISFS